MGQLDHERLRDIPGSLCVRQLVAIRAPESDVARNCERTAGAAWGDPSKLGHDRCYPANSCGRTGDLEGFDYFA